jgi:uncharacterized small protein (DUF1192 family)
MIITVRLSDHLANHVDSLRRDETTSDAEAVRECLSLRRVDDLQERLDVLETEVKRVEREKRGLLDEREQKRQFARFVEEQRSAEASVGERVN